MTLPTGLQLQLDSRHVETREYELGELGNEVENDASAINRDRQIVAGFSAFNIKIATSSALYFVEFQYVICMYMYVISVLYSVIVCGYINRVSLCAISFIYLFSY